MPVGVHCALLRSKIADREVIDRDVTDTSGRDVAEVFFDDEPIVGDFLLWELLQQGIGFVDRGDQALSPASRSEWLLNSDFTASQHANRCLTRIADAERAIASQDDLTHSLRECDRPAIRSLSVIADEWMTDRFGLHEGFGNNAPVKIMAIIYAER